MSRPLSVLTFLSFAAWTLFAQQPTNTPAAPAVRPPTQTQPAVTAPAVPAPAAATQSPGASGAAAPKKAVDLALAGEAHCRDAKGQSTTCELGDTIFVGFTNLREWTDADPDKNKPKDLVLVLDGRIMKGLTPRGPDTQYKELAFDFKRLDGDQPDSKENRDAWNALLSRSKGNRTINVGVALGGGLPYFGPAIATLQVFPSYSWLIVVFLLGCLALFFLLAHYSDILRDAPSPSGGPKVSYSLARCQMAFWFFIVVAAYNYIWMLTGDRDSLTSGTVILMGISSATALGAFVVDSNKRDQRQSLLNEQNALNARPKELTNALAAAPPPANIAEQLQIAAEQLQKQTRLAAVNTALQNLPSPPAASVNLPLDILRDETGISLHRFQMAIWTLVLGFVFVVTVYQSLAMPDFSATLLGLMGISAGTYIGFKIPDPPK